MDRNNLSPNPVRSRDPLSQVLRASECNRVDFLLENRTYENLLKVVPPFGPKISMFEDTDPWNVTIWTSDTVEEIKAVLVEVRDRLVPDGYRDMGMPKHIGALAACKINGDPAFPDLAEAMETIRRVSDPVYWKEQATAALRQPVAI
jgi:hypothetical protein